MKTSGKLGIVGAVMLVVGIGAALIFGDTWHGEPFANIWGILFVVGVYGGVPVLIVAGIMALIDYARRPRD